MKLVKLLSDYFVVKDGDTIVASTESTDKVQQLSLLEVKQLIGEPITRELFLEDVKNREIHPLEALGITKGFILGWGLCEGENQDKKYSREDFDKIDKWRMENYQRIEDELAKPFEEKAQLLGQKLQEDTTNLPDTFFEDVHKEVLNRAFQSIEPRTEWDVEFVDGELRLI